MGRTSVNFCNLQGAITHVADYRPLDSDTHKAVYDFGEHGKILLQPYFFGCPQAQAVKICLGNLPDRSGYSLRGLEVDGQLLTGVAVCLGPKWKPEPDQDGPFPLYVLNGQAAMRAEALLRDIAEHFYDVINSPFRP